MADETAKLLSSFKNKRAYLKRHVTIIQNLINAPERPPANDTEIHNRIIATDILFDKYAAFEENSFTEELQDKLDDEIEQFSILKTQWHRLKVSVMPTSNLSNANANNQYGNLTKLPQISLPIFDGKYNDWTTFRDSFNSLIHDNAQLSKVNKLQYLKSALKGGAAEVIKCIETTNDNYDVAMRLLEERYENKRAIVNNHIQALLDLPTVNKDNSIAIRRLLDGANQHLRALESMGRPVNKTDDLLVAILTSKLNIALRKDFEEKITVNQPPTFGEFHAFLNQKAITLESIHGKEPEIKRSFNATVKAYKCSFCQQNHSIFSCNVFIKLSVFERFELAKKKKLCLNCLRPGHANKECKSSKCKRCSQSHHTLLHFEQREREVTSENSPTEANALFSNYKAPSTVLLATSIVFIQDDSGKIHEARALLDSGSQINLMTEQFATRLNAKFIKTDLAISGIGAKSSTSNSAVQIALKSKFSDFRAHLKFHLISKISGSLPSFTFDPSHIDIPDNIQLSDPEFYIASHVDLLLGAQVFFEIMAMGRIKSNHSGIILQNTKLGWVVTGGLPDNSNSHASCNVVSTKQLDRTLMKFWELERDTVTNHYTCEEQKCEEHFVNNFNRDESGRFIVALPFKVEPRLGKSYDNAKRRFLSTESKLSKNPTLKTEYQKFMNEYIQLGHMSKTNNSDQDGYYLPHHAVLKEQSLTTRLRVVFDASMTTDMGNSLNDVLLVGPVLQSDLFDILIRFRSHQFVLTSDISKMYRQIRVRSDDTKYQRIFWRERPDKDLEVFELQTVTYGTGPASFLAIRCLFELADVTQKHKPKIAEILRSDFYVDDLITGSDNLEELIEIRDSVNEVLLGGGFELRKWASNEPKALVNFSSTSEENFILNESQNIKTLGLSWNAKADAIEYTSQYAKGLDSITKRNILSTISQIFDPLGMLGPTIVLAKIIMQKLWQSHVGWDDPVPKELGEIWCNFLNQLENMGTFAIPRKVLISNHDTIELHGFSDASEQAYGACIYLKSIDTYGNVQISLLCSKSRVAPLKTQSLPRLELCAAVLLAKLAHRIVTSMKISFTKVSLYTDSTITLAWLRGEPARWKTFVANRVAEVQNLTKNASWHHVRTEENPADMISRGMLPGPLQNNSAWWHGPEFLVSNDADREQSDIEIIDIPEAKTLVLAGEPTLEVFHRFSNFVTLVRVIAWCKRPFNNFRNKTNHISGSLTATEIVNAENVLVQAVQRESFASELASLTKGDLVHPKSKLVTLNPFLDENGIIRVGGRLRRSNLVDNIKFPMVLPSRHPFTILIIRYEHIRNFHAGPQATLAAIRDKYWPLSARNDIRNVTRKCIICFKAKPKNRMPMMGDLPLARIETSRPFLNTGIDYFGPLLLKEGTRKNARFKKAYGALFICMATKAVHIELVTELSTPAFLAALKRFFSRRGCSRTLYSDNATNFVGANNELRDVYEFFRNAEFNKIIDHLSNRLIEWRFIPPRAPHFGGLWEAAVKSAKFHLKRIVGSAHLTFEEMMTILSQTEAILNSRPLIPISSDPNDLSFLTPAHFLIGEPLTALPEHDVTPLHISRLNRWQRLQQIQQHFWARWSKEYLTELQKRSKWRQPGSAIEIGQLVLMKEDNTPPCRWKVGRVCEVHPGKDGVVRVVTVRCGNDTCKRALSKICAFPE